VSGRVSLQRIKEIASLHFCHDQSSDKFVYEKLHCVYTTSCVAAGPIELLRDRVFDLWAKLTIGIRARCKPSPASCVTVEEEDSSSPSSCVTDEGNSKKRIMSTSRERGGGVTI
jgi:hypothetical protein